MFTVTTPPESAEPRQLLEWTYQMLSEIGGILDNMERGVFLDLSTAAPPKPRERQLAFADGTSWNPGSGKGVYCYYNSAWHFLG